MSDDTVDDTLEQPLQRRIGPYELVRVAGRGGMSTVYEAVDGRDGRRVALKVLAPTPHLSREEQQKHLTRLQREADAVAPLHHPNLVQVLDRGTVGDTPETQTHYLVLEYVDGETLGERLARSGPLPREETTAIAAQIAGALDAAHAAGVVHRDVKPGNIMLQSDGAAKLMDFGVARLLDDTEVTHRGMIIGSPAYMSPEQAKGEPVTAASDQWSLAAVLYAMLSGRSPFAAENVPATLYQVTHGVAAPIPDVPPDVMRVFERAFDHDPSHRYPSGAALIAALRAARAARKPALYSVGERPAIVPFSGAASSEEPIGRREKRRPERQSPLLTWVPLAAVLLVACFIFATTLLPRPRQPIRAAATKPRGSVRSTPTPNVAKAGKSRVPPGPPNRTPAVREGIATLPTATPSPVRTPVAIASKTLRPSATPRQEARQPLATATPRPQASESPVAIIEERDSVATPRVLAVRPPASPVLADKTGPSLFPIPSPTVAPVPVPTPRSGLGTATSTSKPATPAPSVTPPTPAPMPPANAADEDASDTTHESLSFLGTWRGMHSGVPATLVIKKQNEASDTFEGIMTVQTADGAVTIAVRGRLQDDAGRPDVVMHERRVVASSTSQVWELGTNTGRLTGADTMSGSGRDRQGRTYSWAFQR